jgi:hypothetical protein
VKTNHEPKEDAMNASIAPAAAPRTAAALFAGEPRAACAEAASADLLSEAGFRELLRTSVSHQWGRFAYYRNICARRGLALADLIAFIDEGAYDRLPSVASTAFKLSKGLLGDLNDLSAPGVFQVSSSTSGDPSYVLTSPEDLAHITARYGETFGFPGVSVAVGFAPSLRILRALSKKAGLKGRRAALRMLTALEGSHSRYDETHVTVDVNVPKTLLNRIIGRPAAVRKMPAAEVASIIRKAEARGQGVSLGGLTLILKPYLDEFGEGEFNLGAKGHVAFSGGGYSGAKGSIRGAKIDKPAFIARIGSVFGIDPELWSEKIKDIYSFTETPAQIEGYWDRGLGDFLFRPAPDHRVYIVDPETEAPLLSGRGLLKVVAPSVNGRPAAANVSVLQFDTAEIVSARPDGRVEAFTHIARLEGAEAGGTVGCAFKAAEIAGE